MGCVLQIPAVNKEKRTETILYPETDLLYIINEYLGDEVAGMYLELLEELQNYREKEMEKDD